MIKKTISHIIPQVSDILSGLCRDKACITLPGLKGSAASFVVAEMLRSNSPNLLVITADQESADEFCRELGFFGGADVTPLQFPAWDAPPFSAVSPHPDISASRLDTIFRLQSGQARVVVMPVAAALQRVIARQTFSEASCYLVAGEEFERDDLLARLVKMGYANVPLVEDRGTFCRARRDPGYLSP